MRNVMPNTLMDDNNLLGSREIRFNNRQESFYPNLMRFCMDFNFHVLQLMLAPVAPNQLAGMGFTLVQSEYQGMPEDPITPTFSTLAQLEAHVRQHQVNILHDYLFGVESLSGGLAG